MEKEMNVRLSYRTFDTWTGDCNQPMSLLFKDIGLLTINWQKTAAQTIRLLQNSVTALHTICVRVGKHVTTPKEIRFMFQRYLYHTVRYSLHETSKWHAQLHAYDNSPLLRVSAACRPLQRATPVFKTQRIIMKSVVLTLYRRSADRFI